jgi:hypothetical protein
VIEAQIRMDGHTPRNLLGPGAAIVNNDSQGLTRLGTAGYIVRDGERYCEASPQAGHARIHGPVHRH